ncbi:CaiB/BaiF CoA transferase family protein [Amycolatopsis alkalitolerans]|uniref:CoA transferase n=1 Tax=Amycolatopsis alkalitolerans TaxID=2547244 RepID=A0A5C4M7V9_9PSEU|nr:CoA transferase [Amycolatopsis alkalitolerans]TNC29465.1 CoA transferase [Amycolatopsis alkalitolerans]
MGGPLTGLKVVDTTTSYAGPTASMYLADLGADVIKVERPGAGDDARWWGPPFVGSASAWFASANRNKRSVVINLRDPEGLATLRTLIGKADVFMENFNPGKLEALDLDHERLRADFPHLIYCAMSGFGLDGPDRTLPGYDLAAQARSGLMSVTGAKADSPQRVSTALSDVMTGMCAALAVSAAVVRQREEGVGDLVDVSLLDADLAVMAPRIAAYLAGEPEPAPSGGADSVLAVYQSFSAADRDLVIAVGNDAMWRRFCVAIGLPDLAERADLVDNAGRRAHREELVGLVGARIATRTAAEWQRVLADAGIPCSLVQRLSEVVTDRQVLARENLLAVPGTDGAMCSVRSPFRLDSIPEVRNTRFPDLGEHTVEVLAEHGFSKSEIARLIERGAIEDGDSKDTECDE